MVENFEYSKAFPFKSEMDHYADLDGAETMKNFLYSYERKLKDNPRFLLPYAPAIFEKTLRACERITKEFCGKIEAKIDYSLFTATIELWCCYVEFAKGEFMSVLHEISLFAISVRITPLTSGDLHITIQMPYFASVQDIEGTNQVC